MTTNNDHIEREYLKHGGAPIVHNTLDDGMPSAEGLLIFGIILFVAGCAALIVTALMPVAPMIGG